MNKGTKEGTEEEVEFVRLMNKKKDLEFWGIINLNPENHYAVRVISHKFGKINNKKIYPKADVFFAKGTISEEYIKTRDYYLDEKDLESKNLVPVDYSGVSIKRKDSSKYQILKMNPSTFEKIFGSFELGAGASIYCQNQKDLVKNTSLLNGWNTNWEKFKVFFEETCDVEITRNNGKYRMELSDAKKIKNYSNKKISEKLAKIRIYVSLYSKELAILRNHSLFITFMNMVS